MIVPEYKPLAEIQNIKRPLYFTICNFSYEIVIKKLTVNNSAFESQFIKTATAKMSYRAAQRFCKALTR